MQERRDVVEMVGATGPAWWVPTVGRHTFQSHPTNGRVLPADRQYRSVARQHPADLAADAGQERITGISGGTHRLGHHLHRGDRAGAIAGSALHALGTFDRTAVATTTALARLVLAVHRTFRCAFGARRARRTRGLGNGAFGTGGRGGSALFALHARLARATRTALAAALTVATTTATTA
jgi:hypothetical protein